MCDGISTGLSGGTEQGVDSRPALRRHTVDDSSRQPARTVNVVETVGVTEALEALRVDGGKVEV